MSWIMAALSARQRAQEGLTELPSVALVRGVLGSWVCWYEACDDVRATYERWAKSGSPQRALAFASYCAALDREDQAARVYCDWAARLRAAKA